MSETKRPYLTVVDASGDPGPVPEGESDGGADPVLGVSNPSVNLGVLRFLVVAVSGRDGG